MERQQTNDIKHLSTKFIEHYLHQRHVSDNDPDNQIAIYRLGKLAFDALEQLGNKQPKNEVEAAHIARALLTLYETDSQLSTFPDADGPLVNLLIFVSKGVAHADA